MITAACEEYSSALPSNIPWMSPMSSEAWSASCADLHYGAMKSTIQIARTPFAHCLPARTDLYRFKSILFVNPEFESFVD